MVTVAKFVRILERLRAKLCEFQNHASHGQNQINPQLELISHAHFPDLRIHWICLKSTSSLVNAVYNHKPDP